MPTQGSTYFKKYVGEETVFSLRSQKADWLCSHYSSTLVPDDRQLSSLAVSHPTITGQ